MTIKDYPLIKYVISFMLGIVSHNYFSNSQGITLVIIFVALSLVFVLFWVNKKQNKIITSLLLFITLLVGNYYSHNRGKSINDYPFKNRSIPNVKIIGSIENISLLHNNKFTIILHSDSVITKDSLFRISRKFQCNVSGNNIGRLKKSFSQIEIGNKISLVGLLTKGREERNPGEFNYYKYLISRNLSGVLYVKNLKSIKILASDKCLLANSFFSVRKWISNKIDELHNRRTASLLKGLLLADRGEIDYKTKENFINSGVIHVLAVSGLHVGFIVLIFMFLFSRLPVYVRTFLTIIGLLLFLFLTGMPASVFRATIMVIVMFIFYLSNREYNSINAIAIAAFILLIINPAELFNPGFQLSFSAVLSILIIYPIISERVTVKNKIAKYLFLFVAVSFSAQLGTLPFTLIYFHKLSVIALITNLFVIPIIGVVVGVGVLTIVVSSFSSVLACYYASSNMLVTDLLMKVVEFAGNNRFAFLYIPNFSLYDGIIFYFFISLLFYAFKNFTNKRAFIMLLFIVFANLRIYFQLDNNELLPKGKLSVMLIDVGQGDAILLKFPDGRTALIDAGNASLSFDNGERIIAPLLKRFSIKKLDYGFITHVDSDHYKGFLYLIHNKLVEHIFKPKLDTTFQKDVLLENEILRSEIKLSYYSKTILDFSNLRFYILNDTTNISYQNLDMNNRSGVFKIVYGNNSFLFTGDAERPAERLLMDQYGDFLECNILKLGHHGSKTGSSFPFLNIVKPKIGAISVGEKNRFGHPSPLVIKRLSENGIAICRTDIEGALLFQSDGFNIKKIDWKEF